MNTIGQNLKITFSGESHSDFLTIEITGLPKNIRIDEKTIQNLLSKRRPQGDLTTGRIELDQYSILQGLKAGLTDGTPLIFRVPNTNTVPTDYQNLEFVPRPGHADYPASVKYPDYSKTTGGGMFSGRMTVLFSIIGGIAKPILNDLGIYVASHIAQIGSIMDLRLNPINVPFSLVERLESQMLPLIDETKAEDMKAQVRLAKASIDSVGGMVESAITGLPVGLGEPLFDSLESTLSHLLFSIPAVKGVEFGDGFSFVKSLGSAVSDGYTIDENQKIVTIENHNGGILGGMSTGMPVIIRTAIKPTSSIGVLQKSIHLKTLEPVDLKVSGRHDPAIVLRAVHVVNAVLYYGILDLLMAPDMWKRVH